MKESIFFTVLMLSSAITVLVQKQDTSIYHSCRLTTDTETRISGQLQPRFVSCPQFGNGPADLFKFIAANIRYPATARAKRLQGRVIVLMIIEKDGSISHAKVVHGISKDLNNEALRVIHSLPKWRPAILNKKPVRMDYFIPVEFSLKNHQS
jgi:TonB family protein